MSKIIDDEEDIDILDENDDDIEDDILLDENDDDDEIENIDEDNDENNEIRINKNISNNYDEYNEYSEYKDEDEIYNEEDEEENIENYLQKINDDIKSCIITNYHPELKIHNYEEIQLLTKIKRDNNGDIIDDLHKTSPFMTKYERARILSERTVQINSGSPSFLDNLSNDIIDGYLIALEELKQKKIPFIIKRPLPNGSFEYWNLSDLELL